MQHSPEPYHWHENDLILQVLIQANANTDQIIDIHAQKIRIKIKSAAIDGKANKNLIGFLAKQFSVPKSRIIIEKGLATRCKRVRVIAPKQWPPLIDGRPPSE
ncbi:MAG: DUF167 family protein [Thiohalomonadales bacterium]